MVIQRRLPEVLVHGPCIPVWCGQLPTDGRDATGRGQNAAEKTRTSTGFPPQAPQACASTISPRPHRGWRRIADGRGAFNGGRCGGALARVRRVGGLSGRDSGHAGASRRDPGRWGRRDGVAAGTSAAVHLRHGRRPADLFNPAGFPTYAAGGAGSGPITRPGSVWPT